MYSHSPQKCHDWRAKYPRTAYCIHTRYGWSLCLWLRCTSYQLVQGDSLYYVWQQRLFIKSRNYFLDWLLCILQSEACDPFLLGKIVLSYLTTSSPWVVQHSLWVPSVLILFWLIFWILSFEYYKWSDYWFRMFPALNRQSFIGSSRPGTWHCVHIHKRFMILAGTYSSVSPANILYSYLL